MRARVQYRHINNRFLSIGVRSSNSNLSMGITICTAAPVWHTEYWLFDVVKRYVSLPKLSSYRLLSFFPFLFSCNVIVYNRGEQCDMYIFATNIVKILQFSYNILLLLTLSWRFQKFQNLDIRSMSHTISLN